MEGRDDAYREDERADERKYQKVYLREDQDDVTQPLGQGRDALRKETVPETGVYPEERLERIEEPVLDLFEHLLHLR